MPFRVQLYPMMILATHDIFFTLITIVYIHCTSACIYNAQGGCRQHYQGFEAEQKCHGCANLLDEYVLVFLSSKASTQDVTKRIRSTQMSDTLGTYQTLL